MWTRKMGKHRAFESYLLFCCTLMCNNSGVLILKVAFTAMVWTEVKSTENTPR